VVAIRGKSSIPKRMGMIRSGFPWETEVAIRCIKKGIPTAIAVQSRGTNTRRRGSFWVIPSIVRITAPGISQRRAKFVSSAESVISRKGIKIRQKIKGTSAGAPTISIPALIHRDNSKPPGSIKAPRKN
jgi:hypothetical protein